MIIILSGSINSGKSSVAREIVKCLPNTAHVEVDVLRGFIDWMPLEASIPINIQNAASLITNFSERGLNVVATYPLTSRDYGLLINALESSAVPIYTFTLCPPKAVALSNRNGRALSDWEKDRISEHYQSDIVSPSFGSMIDNSEETPTETSKRIMNQIGIG